MHLLAPGYLWFLAAAAIPPLLYLLFRRRRRDVAWGAMFILRRVLESRSRQNVWLQYLIIALRALAFAAIAFVFLRPFLPWRAPEDGSFPSPPPGTHRIVLVDCSRGMDVRFEGGTAADAARSLCGKLVRGMRFPGRIDILPLGGEGAEAFMAFPPDEEELARRLGRFAPGDTPADVAAGLRNAMARFREHGEFPRRELYLLSDFSARTFGGDGGGGADGRNGGSGGDDGGAFAAAFASLHRLGVRVFGIEFRRPGTGNTALLDLTSGADLVLARIPELFTLTAAYYGPEAAAETWLTVSDGAGRLLHEGALTLAPGEQQVVLPLALPAGDTTVTATLREDALAWDNAIERGYRVAEELRVALVQNITMRRGFENPREWLDLALVRAGRERPVAGADVPGSAAEAIAMREVERAEASTVSESCRFILEGKIPEQLADANLEEADAAILLDVDTLDEERIAVLRRFMARGGTVLLAPGPDALPERFNASFAALAPCAIGAPLPGPIDPTRYESALADKLDDPLIRELDAPQHGNLGNPRFYNRYAVDAASFRPDAETLLSLSDGATLLAERRFGRGRCLLWTAGLGGEWHSFVVHPGYPVFLMRILARSAAGRRFALNLQPGQPIIREMTSPRVLVLRPDDTREEADTLPFGDGRILRYDRTDRPGRYVVFDGVDETAASFPYHVAGDRRASDIRALAPEDRAALEETWGHALSNDETTLAATAGQEYGGASLGLVAAALVLVCLLLESGLSRKYFS